MRSIKDFSDKELNEQIKYDFISISSLGVKFW